jgi:PAS domain S-box-containing protein
MLAAKTEAEHPSEPVAPARWMALVSAVERLATAKSLEEIIETVRETARAVSGADGVTFVLRDEDRCHYVEEDAVGPLWKGKRFPLTACISGWCMLNDEKAVISDIYADPRIPHDAYRPTFVKSLIMVPVKTDWPIAAIGSYWGQRREFDDGEVQLLEALARSTSAALAAVEMRKSLQESEARLGMALTAGKLGVWELELEPDTLSASPLCKTIFGRGEDDAFTAGDLRAAIHPDDLEAQHAAFRDAITQRSDLYSECRIVRPDASVRWVAMRGRAVIDGTGEPARLSCVVGDVTERREARERMDRLNAEIAHIGRLTEMGEMVSAFAHELRQPLTAANNYLGAAKRKLDGDGNAAREMIDKADAQFARATQIIQRIRSFAGKTASEKAPENVAAMIAEAVELAKLDPRHRGVSVRLDVEDGVPEVLVDKVQIQQVLLNLLRNAFEAMERSSRHPVDIRARNAADGAVEISVSDTGPGLANDVAAKLFQPFTTTKEGGMGVGLSICRRIIEGHGGRMWVDSEPGAGACFFFTVPGA